ncbi:MAG: radical SAM protein [Deltaproteobacteria bacterium]|nr:radical SAM protein [Deltaproteobacteria bacterium]
MDKLNKIYVEPTSRCNLSCVTCIRHSWDEPFGDMEWPVYEALINGLEAFPEAKTIAFAGFGEPLVHPRFPEMIRLAHERGLRTEMTSNAMLLTSALAEKLIDAGLDQFTVSIDGTSEEAHGAVRPGASLERITENVQKLYWWSKKKRTEQLGIASEPESVCCAVPSLSEFEHMLLAPMAHRADIEPSAPLKIGIEFVAMKSNIHELPAIQEIAAKIRASYIIVSNVLPYTAEMQGEILYNMGPTSYEGEGATFNPLWILPKMDWNRDTLKPLTKIMSQQPNLSYLDINLNQRNNYCPFVQPGSLAVAWHGGVSPCPPLLHSYTCYLRGWKKSFRRCEYGRLPEESLRAIWEKPEYPAFRERVRKFEFSPCTDCGGCDDAEKNELDCYGNPFPVCGDCLWARGVLRCA